MYYVLIPEKKLEPRAQAERILRSMGATSRLVGFDYALYMIDKIVTGERSVQLITKILYPETAKHFGVKPHAVERAIRTLIELCWRYGDMEISRSWSAWLDMNWSIGPATQSFLI